MTGKENTLRAWIGWTGSEALGRTGTKVLLKAIGEINISLGATVLATIIIGATQTVLGIVGTRIRKATLRCKPAEIIGACAFGTLGYVVTVLSFIVFIEGGDLGINTFITTLAIIPGGLMDKFLFGQRLGIRQWFAIGIAIFAGYYVLNLPSFAVAQHLPLWIWLSLISMLLIGINQGISQKIKSIDPFVKNFYGGLTQMILGLGTLLIFGATTSFSDPHPILGFWIFAILIGIINVGVWVFNILSYRDGASIAIKKIVMNGVHLSSAMLAGILIFGESASFEKFIGIILYLFAFSLWDTEVWKYFSSAWSSTNPNST